MRPAPVLLALAACGSSASSAPPAQSSPEPRFEACPLSETVTLEIPIPPEHALAVEAGACLLVDERAEASAITFAALPSDAEGAEAAVHDPAEFFVATGLLGEDATARDGEAVSFLGRERQAIEWSGTPEGIPTREGFAFASRQGDIYVVVTAMHSPAPEAQADHLRGLVSLVTKSP